MVWDLSCFCVACLLRLCCVGCLLLILLAGIFAKRHFGKSVRVQITPVCEDVALLAPGHQLSYFVFVSTTNDACNVSAGEAYRVTIAC